MRRPPGRRALPLVAVVGRPNVGKSTLVNRIVGRREAIVEERPGVTRDRKYLDAEWAGRQFTLVDTGGWLAGGGTLDRQVSAQSERAIREAAAILLVVDATVGITDDDAKVAALLRRSAVPVIVVANKVDGDSRDSDAWAFARLGLGDPFPVSASPRARDRGPARRPGRAFCPRSAKATPTRLKPTGSRTSRRWPSWGGRTWASPPCSTA